MLLASLIFSGEREGMKEKGKDELKERIPQKFRLLRKSNGVGRFIFDGWQDTLCSTYKMPHPGRLKQTWCGREADFPMPKVCLLKGLATAWFGMKLKIQPVI